jgi:DNA-binding response OmpR family regulator
MKRVLIVDDDPDILLSLSLLLDALYELCLARDGAEALQLLDGGFAADVIVLDLMMPVLDGTAMARELQRRGSRIPIILASAQSDLPGRARDLEAADYVMKPFRFEVLQAKLTRVLARPSGGLDDGASSETRHAADHALRGDGAGGRTSVGQPREIDGEHFPRERELDSDLT